MAFIQWIVPSAILKQITPLHSLPSIIKSITKYSTKKEQLYPNALPNRVWSIEWPVLSATAQHLYAYPPLPYFNDYPPNALWYILPSFVLENGIPYDSNSKTAFGASLHM